MQFSWDKRKREWVIAEQGIGFLLIAFALIDRCPPPHRAGAMTCCERSCKLDGHAETRRQSSSGERIRYLGFRGEQGEFLVCLIGDGCVGILRFDLRVELGGLGGILLAVV